MRSLKNLKRLNCIKKFSSFFLILLLICVSTFFTSASITLNSIVTTESTCENNGTATINAVSAPDPFLLYKITSGPILSNMQTSNVFTSLYPGNYTAVLYDSNFDSLVIEFTISGNYQLPFFTTSAFNPTCVGFNDGMIIGIADSTNGLLPYSWEIISPIYIGPQATDTFDNLDQGTYQIRMTDACGNFVTRTQSLSYLGTGLSFINYPQIEMIGCDTLVVNFGFVIYGSSLDLPFTLNCTSGTGAVFSATSEPTYYYLYGADSYVAYISDTISGLTYGDMLTVSVTDVCGASISGGTYIIPPFLFSFGFFNVTTTNCSIELGANANLYNIYNWPYYHWTTMMPPIHYELVNNNTGLMADSGTLLMTSNGVLLTPQPQNELFNFSITDGCGNSYESQVQWPSVDAPSIQIQQSAGCKDSTASVYFTFLNFLSNPVLTITSGPPLASSSKPGYAFSDTIIYPVVFDDINVNLYGGAYAINHFPKGTYTYTVTDSCGNTYTGSFTVTDVSNLGWDYTIEYGCYGDNSIQYNTVNYPSGQLIAAIIKEVASGDVVDSNYPYNGNGSANSLDPGDYAVELYYSYALQFGGQLFNNSLTGNTDCWVYMDTITVPPFSANSFQSVTTITCSGITYVNLVVDSNSGVPPYLYEVIAGPQTFPPQASNLFTIDDPGIYLFRITDSCNNTFIQQVTVTTDSFPNIIKQGSSCVGSAINLIAIASPYFSYEWLSPNGSIYYGNIFSINPLTIADTGTYLITKYVSINGCVDTFYSSYVVNLNNTYEINATICTGQSYTIGTNSYNLTGQYVDTLSAAVGCDSIIYLNLTVTDFKRDSMELTICSGESITLGGATYTQAGIYVDTIPTTTCDSIFKLTLYLLDYKRDTINAQLCEGESYSMGGNSFAVSGTYIDTLSTSTCDSIITLNLSITDFIRDTIDIAICQGNTYLFNNTLLSVAGTFNDTLSTSTCDSIITLNLSITDFIRDTIDIAICQGNTYLFNNTALSAAGTFNDTLSTSTCDSIITLNLSITDYLRDTIDIAICQGNTYQLGQNTLTLAGLYTDTLSGSTCDSIIILTLSVTPPPQQSVQYTICANESVIVGNNTYTQPGFYSDTLVTGNCDSILLIAIDVLPFGFDTIYPVICQDELYTLGNTSYNTSGVYTDTVSTSGCDSILTVFLTVNSSPNVNITASDSVVYPNDIVRLNSSAYNVSYQWNSIAELSDPFIKNPSATMTESAWIYITIENDYGCTAEDSIYVRVIQVDCDERKLFVPNSFSPNGDGVNDKFFAIANQVEFIEMQIFNRWGQLVFQSNDINSKWDGRFKDTIELGLYVYWIRYAGCEEELTKGTILLLE